MGEVRVEFDTDVRIELLHEPQAVIRVEDKCHLEEQFLLVKTGRYVPDGGGRLADQPIINALLNFLVEQRVVGGER